MTLEILHVKLIEVYYSAVWNSTLITSVKYLVICQFVCLMNTASNFFCMFRGTFLVPVLWCTGIRCQHTFAINMALVRQFSAINSKNCFRALGVTNLKI